MKKLAHSQPANTLPTVSVRRTSRLRFIRRRSRQGLTLVELLIAVALTLVIISAMIRAFKASSDQISLGRAKMDMHNKMRFVTETLRRDLQNATRTPNPLDTSDGYFEYVEGEETDADHATDELSFIGDHDDVLALTIRSGGEPFRGRWTNDNGTPTDLSDDFTETVESYLAEVIWFIVHDDDDGDGEVSYDEAYRLYRRVLLIRPDLETGRSWGSAEYFENNDVSAHPDGTDIVTNSLEDLADRRNRYAHNRRRFPHEIQAGLGAQANWLAQRVLGEDNGDGILNSQRIGEDLMLDGCVAFDIKVYDPTAEVFVPLIDAAGAPYLPTTFQPIGQPVGYDDPGFSDLITNYAPATYTGFDGADFVTSYPQAGAYVNLGYDPGNADDASAAESIFPDNISHTNYDASHDRVLQRWFASHCYPNNLAAGSRPYSFEANTLCTWTDAYERDGLDQDDGGSGLIDEGTDGVDNDAANGVDDNLERETPPPYAYPARSIQVSVRMIEKRSNLVLQKSVRESFVPN